MIDSLHVCIHVFLRSYAQDIRKGQHVDIWWIVITSILSTQCIEHPEWWMRKQVTSNISYLIERRSQKTSCLFSVFSVCFFFYNFEYNYMVIRHCLNHIYIGRVHRTNRISKSIYVQISTSQVFSLLRICSS